MGALTAKPELIPRVEMNKLARPLLKLVAKAFEDPKIKAEYEAWLIEYKKRPEVIAREAEEAARTADERR